MKGYLVLADGTIFQGDAFGAPGRATGEVVFTTGMTGYQEEITDPSYWGQIVVNTYPLVGNTGINPEDFESGRPHLRGLVVRELCTEPSHWQATETLAGYLKRHGVVGLTGVDTRALTRVLRIHGAMGGVIVAAAGGEVPAEAAQDLDAPGGLLALAGEWRVGAPPALRTWLLALVGEARNFRLTGAVAAVTPREPYRVGPGGTRGPAGRTGDPGAPHVVMVDLGAKQNIVRSLVQLGCEVTVVPADTSLRDLLALAPDGVLISNGPGDPKEARAAIETARGLLQARVPTMGICLGHQVLGLALGADTYKMKFGHRGVNHPVQELASRRVFITTQNHGYAIDETSLPPGVTVTHRNLSDGTVEGIAVEGRPAFSVQYHPEACPGPEESRFLFERFLELMRGHGPGGRTDGGVRPAKGGER